MKTNGSRSLFGAAVTCGALAACSGSGDNSTLRSFDGGTHPRPDASADEHRDSSLSTSEMRDTGTDVGASAAQDAKHVQPHVADAGTPDTGVDAHPDTGSTPDAPGGLPDACRTNICPSTMQCGTGTALECGTNMDAHFVSQVCGVCGEYAVCHGQGTVTSCMDGCRLPGCQCSGAGTGAAAGCPGGVMCMENVCGGPGVQ